MDKKIVGMLAIGLCATPTFAASQPTNALFGESNSFIFWALVGLLVLQVLVVLLLLNVIKNLTENRSIWAKYLNKLPGAILVISWVLSSSAASANSGVALDEAMTSTSFYWLVGMNAALFGLMLFILSVLKQLLSLARAKPAVKVEKEEGPSLVEELTSKLVDIVAIEEEHTILMNHEYDGIQELDNNLPPWWKWGFYLTIVWGIIYVVHYHVLKTGPLQAKEYETELIMAEKAKMDYLANAKNLVDEHNVKQLTEQSALASGGKFFAQNCAACHGRSGEGNAIGPNLTDEYWLHGGSVSDVFTTVKYGVPSKGMQSWKNEMGPALMQEVVSYVLSLQGSNPANAKAPQGDKMEVNSMDNDSLTTAADFNLEHPNN